MSVVIVKETVNLNKLKNQIGVVLGNETTQNDSHYRRLTRFFDEQFHLFSLWKYLLKIAIEALILRLDQRGGHKYLLMDATSWEFGKIKFQFLFLSVVYEGISIPIFFVNLGKKGHRYGEPFKFRWTKTFFANDKCSITAKKHDFIRG